MPGDWFGYEIELIKYPSRFCLSVCLFNLFVLPSVYPFTSSSFFLSFCPSTLPVFGLMLCWLYSVRFLYRLEAFLVQLSVALNILKLEKYLVICVSPLKITLALLGSCASSGPITVSRRIGLSKGWISHNLKCLWGRGNFLKESDVDTARSSRYLPSSAGLPFI